MGTQETQGNVLSVSLLDSITRRVSQAGERDAAFVDVAPKVEHAIPSHEVAHNPLEAAFGKPSLNHLLSGHSNLLQLLAIPTHQKNDIRRTASANTAPLWAFGLMLTGLGLVFFGKAVGILAWNIWSILS